MTRRIHHLLLATTLALLCIATTYFGLQQAQAGPTTALVPIGAGYEAETLELFAQQALNHNGDLTVTLRVLPITYATDPFSITPQERAENLALAEQRADQVDASCEVVAPDPVVCLATVVDIQVRDDASNPNLVGQLDSSVDGIYILGGDQVIAMQVVANTPTEEAMETLYWAGAVLGGNSAGSAVQSRYMIAGYIGDNYAWHGLNFGAVDLWFEPTTEITRGLRYGLEVAVIEQHALERGRTARLLQAMQRKPEPHLAIGSDWATGIVVLNGQVVTQTAGGYAGLVLDGESYGSAANAVYSGPAQTLSIHDVAYHLLPEGSYGYDLAAMRPIVNAVLDDPLPDISGRSLNFFAVPETAGSLILAGDLALDPAGAVSQRFVSLAQSSSEPTLVLAAGYGSTASARNGAQYWRNQLVGLGLTNVQTATLLANSNMATLISQIEAAGAIFMVGNDQQIMAGQIPLMQINGLDLALEAAWHSGSTLLMDKGAAAAAGDWMTAEPSPSDIEVYASDSFIADYVNIGPGLGFISGASFEPRVLYDYLYGRLANHVYQHPETVVFGLEIGTALEITPSQTSVLGESAVFVLDGRYHRVLEAGLNNVIAATWLLIDTFAPGDVVAVQPPPPPPVWYLYLPATFSD